MIRAIWLSLLLGLSGGKVWAQSCIVHSHAQRLDVTVCQENLSIPPQLFHDGFCQPNLPGQSVDVTFVAQCPKGAFGVCRNAQVVNMPYRQNIHYYGVASDAAYLKPYCENQSKGQWYTY